MLEIPLPPYGILLLEPAQIKHKAITVSKKLSITKQKFHSHLESKLLATTSSIYSVQTLICVTLAAEEYQCGYSYSVHIRIYRRVLGTRTGVTWNSMLGYFCFTGVTRQSQATPTLAQWMLRRNKQLYDWEKFHTRQESYPPPLSTASP